MASGNAGYGLEYQRVAGFDPHDVGAVFLKGTTLAPKKGNRPERVWETPCGLLNSVGLENPGVDVVVNELLPQLDHAATRYIANVSGSSLEEYEQVARRFDDSPVAAIEVNISCPNVKKGGAAFGNDPDMAARVTEVCRQATTKPLIVKLSPNQTDIAEGARRVIEAGADMLSAINTLMGMAIDIDTMRPTLGNNQGGLSGPAIKPVALLKVHQVYQVARPHGVPIIGLGGIATAEDAIEFFLAGASMVAVGTMLASDPLLLKKLNRGIAAYLERKGLRSVAELTGRLQLNTDTVLC